MFATKRNRNRHILSHTGEKPFVCKICKRAFSRIGNLKEHEYTHEAEKTYKCQICPDERFFRSPQQLHKHMVFHKEKRHKCFQCGKMFHRRQCLKIHTRSHSKIKPHGCPHCRMSFIDSGALEIHIRAHTESVKEACSH